MKLSVDRLNQNLGRQLFPIYLVHGDEPLQRGEAVDAVRMAAKNAGYSEREVFDVESGFQWDNFTQSCDSLPLFAEKRILDLKVLSGSVGKAGGKALLNYAQRPAEDIVLLINSGKLSASAQKSAWFKAIDKVGVTIQVWPLTGARLLQWVGARSKAKGLAISREGLTVLTERVEGNMLAAAQEIDKLFMVNGAGKIDEDRIYNSVADSARFDVFALVDGALRGDAKRAYRILESIQREGVALPIILWALIREIRLLHQIDFEAQHGGNVERILRDKKVWEKRKPLLRGALKRNDHNKLKNLLRFGARLDRVIKGRESGDAWEMMLFLCMSLAGVESIEMDRIRV